MSGRRLHKARQVLTWRGHGASLWVCAIGAVCVIFVAAAAVRAQPARSATGRRPQSPPARAAQVKPEAAATAGVALREAVPLLQAGKRDEAEALIRRAIALAPSNPVGCR